MNRQATLKILLDSNVLISAYPEIWGGAESATEDANKLLSLSNEHGHTTYRHPASLELDFGNITDAERREWRRTVARNHPELPAPPEMQPAIEALLGDQKKQQHMADNRLLAAVAGDAVHMLVTNDKGVLRKARKLELGERVVNIEDAIATLTATLPTPTRLELVPEQTFAHTLDETDPIFDSLRADYHPNFDDWFSKCKREHRDCWVVRDEGGALVAVTIVKEEYPPEFGAGGKTLKICLFKVSDEHPGMSYGELLLESVFDYCYKNEYESTYVTALPKHARVAEFFEQFGFRPSESQKTGLGESVCEKRLIPPSGGDADAPDNLEFHIQYGPRYYALESQRFIVPIKPKFHESLFPGFDGQMRFKTTDVLTRVGNALRKAYLSQGSIRKIAPGAILYFYRSHDRQRITVVGVVESVAAYSDPKKIESYVGGRTVYTRDQILDLTDNGNREVLAILFRRAKILNQGPTKTKLGEWVWKSPPQSIMEVTESGAKWLRQHVDDQ